VDAAERLIVHAERISAYAYRLKEARDAKYQKYPSVFLPDLVADPEHAALLEAVDALRNVPAAGSEGTASVN
jgi:hypothetical protein